MTIRKPGGVRNYGFGRSLRYAARVAILDSYGPGRYSTRYTLIRRIYRFVAFIRLLGINDYRLVTRAVVETYGRLLRTEVTSGRLAIATAVNYLSAVNCLMAHMRGDRAIRVSPRRLIGRRDFVRRDPPIGINYLLVNAVAKHLEGQGEIGLAAMLRLCRVLGLRHKEAALLVITEAHRQARETGHIQVQLGTKGGRPRSVPVDAIGLETLAVLARRYHGARNVIPERWSYIRWSRYCYRTFRQYATDLGVSFTFRDLRAAFACELYETHTGEPAPVVAGGRHSDLLIDRWARQLIAEALGHGRLQIAGAYIGTTRRPRE